MNFDLLGAHLADNGVGDDQSPDGQGSHGPCTDRQRSHCGGANGIRAGEPGTVERLQPATAYDLKRLAGSTVFNFWALHHTALYTETQRLCDAGLLAAVQEDGGRRRRRFSLTDTGLAALDRWRAEPAEEFLEIRDPGLLRLFVGADPRVLAAAQLERHEAQLATYEELDRTLAHAGARPDPARSTLAAGIAIERVYVRFWSALVRDGGTTADEL